MRVLGAAAARASDPSAHEPGRPFSRAEALDPKFKNGCLDSSTVPQYCVFCDWGFGSSVLQKRVEKRFFFFDMV